MPSNLPPIQWRSSLPDDFDDYAVCSECGTHMLIGDEDHCPICGRDFCEECFEDHDCGFMEAQAEAKDL